MIYPMVLFPLSLSDP